MWATHLSVDPRVCHLLGCVLVCQGLVDDLLDVLHRALHACRLACHNDLFVDCVCAGEVHRHLEVRLDVLDLRPSRPDDEAVQCGRDVHLYVCVSRVRHASVVVLRQLEDDVLGDLHLVLRACHYYLHVQVMVSGNLERKGEGRWKRVRKIEKCRRRRNQWK